MRWSLSAAVTRCLLFAATLLVIGALPARAQEYVIGAEDVLQISVWMHPELEKTVTVNSDGNVTFAPIGEVKAAGLTPAQLADRLGDRLSTYLRQTTTVTVTVTQFLSHSVFVSGAVATPGRYGFEKIPSLVDVINRAGGATPGADLSGVQIIRREGDRRRPTTVDVAAAMRTGNTANLPALRPGDTIMIPGGLGGGVTPGDAAGVIGEVNKPGLYPVGAGQDLLTVLAAAGGPTQKGSLSNIRVVTRQGASQSVTTVNLKPTLKQGARAPYMVRPGDVVVVASSGSVWTGFANVLAVSRDILNLVIVADYFRNND